MSEATGRKKEARAPVKAPYPMRLHRRMTPQFHHTKAFQLPTFRNLCELKRRNETKCQTANKRDANENIPRRCRHAYPHTPPLLHLLPPFIGAQPGNNPGEPLVPQPAAMQPLPPHPTLPPLFYKSPSPMIF